MIGFLPIYIDDLRYELLIKNQGQLTLSKEPNASLYLPQLAEPVGISYQDGALFYRLGQEEWQALVPPQTIAEIIHVFPLQSQKETVIDARSKKHIAINQRDIDFGQRLPRLLLSIEEEGWHLSLLEGEVYINNRRFLASEQFLQLGDEIGFADKKIKVLARELHLWGEVGLTDQVVRQAGSQYRYYEGYPDYHRSPRLIYRGSEDKLDIKPPPQEPRKPTDQLLKLIIPPLMMISITILITLIQPRGIYILMTMSMSAVTLVFSVSNYIKNRKQYKEDLKERESTYKAYLADKSIELRQKAEEYRKGLLYHYPDIQQIDQMAQRYHHRIYEKTALHFDFLHYRLGMGTITPTYQVTYSEKEHYKKTDQLEKEGHEVYEANRQVDDVPVVTDLLHGPVGYIGERTLVIEQLHLMVSQLAFFHSYHDLQIIPIFPEEELEQWEWLRWLPHSMLQGMNVRGFVYNQRTRDQVLNSLSQILQGRQNQKREEGARDSTIFTPHYLVLITDEKLVLDHTIMEFFNEDPTELGCSIIFVQDVLSSLSENVKTIINIKDVNYGELLIEEGEIKNLTIQLDHFPQAYDKESISRRLAPLNHLQNLKSSIPESVTFLEMYQVEEFRELGIPKRWQQNSPYKSLAVPIGLRGKDDIVNLNLHEKAHGPHGLVAGTTGSGKSELIQSYILSLAVNFHPHDVGFLLIDYKGGGMANLFRRLPHLLGTITNLDGAQSMRALASIEAELQRRQRLFARYNVNHINQYQKKYRHGEAREPMPHLFLISDEFAELKADQPDFMTKLVSTARIGRSLGIHLILATQKPSGVVNDQIWSNSRFKIALKVADRSDSQEMLRTPDAADIRQAGRAYLQVGNNEIYELFQSAWSGADYQPNKDEQGIDDQAIYSINDLGQYDVINEDLSGLGEVEDVREVPTELDAVVEGIRALVEDLSIPALPQPWLPPLPEQLFMEDLSDVAIRWENVKTDLAIVYGMIDIPSQQSQIKAEHDFAKDGHLAIFSGPGMGKTTFLETVVMDLVRKNNPEQLHLYLMDFGTNGLLPLLGLPHTADIIYSDDATKIPKLVNRITEELKQRKALFSRYMVSSLEAYERASKQSLPSILFVVDAYEGVRNTAYEFIIDNFLAMVARDGVNMGIYIVLSTGRLGTLKAGLQANIKNKISLKMTEDTESRSVVGRHQIIMDDLPGRGLVRVEQPEIVQIAQPTAGEDTFAIQENLKAEISRMDSSWTGRRPSRIPVVPDTLTVENFSTMPTTKQALQKQDLPIGLNYGDVVAVSLPLNQLGHLLVDWDKMTARQIAMTHLYRMVSLLEQPEEVTIWDWDDLLADYAEDVTDYVKADSGSANLAKKLEALKDQIVADSRKHRYADRFVFIGDLPSLLEQSGIKANDFALIHEEGRRVGYHLIFAVNKTFLMQSGEIQRYLNMRQTTAIIAGMKMTDQAFFKRSDNNVEAMLSTDQVYLHHRDVQTLLKVTR